MRISIASIILTLLLGCDARSEKTGREKDGCATDADCKGSRVCVKGECAASEQPAPQRVASDAPPAQTPPLTPGEPPPPLTPAATIPPPPLTPVATPPPLAPATTPPPAATAPARQFKVVYFDAVSAGRLDHQGHITQGASWIDAAGGNTFFLTRQQGRTANNESVIQLRAYHYVRDDSSVVRLVREVKEGGAPCEFADVTGFATDSVRIADQDADSIGEISFAYTVGCSNDPSPQSFKFLLLEGGAKYILRGQTRIQGQGGSYVADPGIDSWPAPMRTFADSEWKRLALKG